MKISKYRLRNKTWVDFLTDSISVYVEREITTSINYEYIIDDFKLLKERKSLL